MSANEALTRILDAARLHTPGALDGVLLLEFFNTAKEFFRRTDCWRDHIELFIQPGIPEYPLNATAPAQVIKLIWLEGLRPIGGLQNPIQHGPQRVGHLIVNQSRNKVLFVPVLPAGPEAWHAHVSLTIADPVSPEGVPYFPNELLSAYHETLLDGLLSKVLMHAKKPYSDQQLAAFHGRRFNNGISVARNEARSGFLADGQHWQYPQQFANRRGQRLY